MSESKKGVESNEACDSRKSVVRKDKIDSSSVEVEVEVGAGDAIVDQVGCDVSGYC